MYGQEGENDGRKKDEEGVVPPPTGGQRRNKKTRRCLNLSAVNNGEITCRNCQVDRKEKEKEKKEEGAITTAWRSQR